MSTNGVSTDTVRAYLHALERADAAALVALLSPTVRFVSPFSTWTTPHSAARACAARCRAITAVTGVAVLSDGVHGVVRWHGRIGDVDLEGIELLALADDCISRIDVFLRPANALDIVYGALTAAW